MNGVRRRAPGANRLAVYAVEMMRGADRDAIGALVAAAPRPVAQVVIVQIATRAAPGNGAAPAVAREHRIAVARGAFPLGDHMSEDPLERRPARLGGMGEGIERIPEERDDRRGTSEAYLGVRNLGDTRTDLHECHVLAIALHFTSE
jgi:hypothetical protein